MSEYKRNLRKWAKERRAKLQSDEADVRIAERIIRSFLVKAQSFFVYDCIGTEVNTWRILYCLNERKKILCIPCIKDGVMLSARMAGDMEEWKFGIRQPKNPVSYDCEVAIIPLLCADRQGNRLGYGGGYYDRYLQAHERILRVGICYDGQLVDEILAEEHDCQLDFIVTEEQIICCCRKEMREIAARLMAKT
jgi:5-formyltetrahydrofolate cyclo-ligase